MIKNETFKLRIDSESKQYLLQLAEQNNQSKSSIVRELIKLAKQSPSLLSNTTSNYGKSN